MQVATLLKMALVEKAAPAKAALGMVQAKTTHNCSGRCVSKPSASARSSQLPSATCANRLNETTKELWRRRGMTGRLVKQIDDLLQEQHGAAEVDALFATAEEAGEWTCAHSFTRQGS